MTILSEKKESRKAVIKESAQDRTATHRIGVKLCEGFFNQAYKSNGDISSLRDSVAGLLDGCNEVLLRFVENNQFKNPNAQSVISRMSVALDDSFTEVQKIRV